MKNRFIRKINRLPNSFIYENCNWYFVTICVQDRKSVFEILSGCGTVSNGDIVKGNGENGDIINGDTVVASTKICKMALLNLYNLYQGIILDEWVIMPNHIHFIIGSEGKIISKVNKKTSNLGNIVKSFKLFFQTQIVEATTVSPLKYLQINPHKFWQKSFYDHVIRDNNDLERIRKYIMCNPQNWIRDKLKVI